MTNLWPMTYKSWESIRKSLISIFGCRNIGDSSSTSSVSTLSMPSQFFAQHCIMRSSCVNPDWLKIKPISVWSEEGWELWQNLHKTESVPDAARPYGDAELQWGRFYRILIQKRWVRLGSRLIIPTVSKEPSVQAIGTGYRYRLSVQAIGTGYRHRLPFISINRMRSCLLPCSESSWRTLRKSWNTIKNDEKSLKDSSRFLISGNFGTGKQTTTKYCFLSGKKALRLLPAQAAVMSSIKQV